MWSFWLDHRSSSASDIRSEAITIWLMFSTTGQLRIWIMFISSFWADLRCETILNEKCSMEIFSYRQSCVVVSSGVKTARPITFWSYQVDLLEYWSWCLLRNIDPVPFASKAKHSSLNYWVEIHTSNQRVTNKMKHAL